MTIVAGATTSSTRATLSPRDAPSTTVGTRPFVVTRFSVPMLCERTDPTLDIQTRPANIGRTQMVQPVRAPTGGQTGAFEKRWVLILASGFLLAVLIGFLVGVNRSNVTIRSCGA